MTPRNRLALIAGSLATAIGLGLLLKPDAPKADTASPEPVAVDAPPKDPADLVVPSAAPEVVPEPEAEREAVETPPAVEPTTAPAPTTEPEPELALPPDTYTLELTVEQFKQLFTPEKLTAEEIETSHFFTVKDSGVPMNLQAPILQSLGYLDDNGNTTLEGRFGFLIRTPGQLVDPDNGELLTEGIYPYDNGATYEYVNIRLVSDGAREPHETHIHMAEGIEIRYGVPEGARVNGFSVDPKAIADVVRFISKLEALQEQGNDPALLKQQALGNIFADLLGNMGGFPSSSPSFGHVTDLDKNDDLYSMLKNYARAISGLDEQSEQTNTTETIDAFRAELEAITDFLEQELALKRSYPLKDSDVNEEIAAQRKEEIRAEIESRLASAQAALDALSELERKSFQDTGAEEGMDMLKAERARIERTHPAHKAAPSTEVDATEPIDVAPTSEKKAAGQGR